MDKQRVALGPALQDWQRENLEHTRYEYDLSFNDLVIDIGAYKGEWAERIYNEFRCSMILIEPTEYIRSFPEHEGKVKIINKAASTHNGKLQFGGGAYYTSVFEQGTHEYECFDICSLLETCGEIALMKVNIEGSEYDILNHIIDNKQHLKIKNIQVQFHTIEGVPYERWYNEIAEKLSKTHELTWRTPFVWENWRIKQ